MGVKGNLARNEKLLVKKIDRGTNNFLKSPATSRADAESTLMTGYEVAEGLAKKGATALAFGEMGIGNTTSATAISAGILNLSAEDLTGPGAGLKKEGVANKREVVTRALERAGNIWEDPLQILTEVGGFEIGALAGAIFGGGFSPYCPVCGRIRGNRCGASGQGFLPGLDGLLLSRAPFGRAWPQAPTGIS